MRAGRREGGGGLEKKQIEHNEWKKYCCPCTCMHTPEYAHPCGHTPECVDRLKGSAEMVIRDGVASVASLRLSFFYSHTGKVEKWTFFSIVLKSIFLSVLQPPWPGESDLIGNSR